MKGIIILLCIILFVYVLFIEQVKEPFQEQEDLDKAEVAALEIQKIKKNIELQHKTILETQKEIGIAEFNNHSQIIKTILNTMQEDYKKAELEMLRAEVASPKSASTVESRKAMIHMKNLIESIKI